jgi:ABC-2 type transport system permease protein
MRAVVTLALKDLRLLSRDWFGMFWILAFPLMFALFFGSIMGGGGAGANPLAVAVVDQDHSAGSRKFIAELESKKNALKVQVMSREEARRLVRQGDLAAYIALGPGFGKSTDFFAGRVPEIELGIDPRRKAEAGYLQGMLTEAAFADMRQVAGKAFGAGPNWLPLKIDQVEVTREASGPLSAFEITFPSAVIWAFIGCVAAFAISLVTERVAGTFLRLRIAPLTRAQLLAGKGLACFLACAAVAVFLLLIGHLAFRVRLENPVGLALALVCSACCFVGMMMLIATLGKTEQGVAGAGWGIMMPLAMIGGGMVPLIAMPAWMLTASDFSPIKWGILAMEGAIWRGFSLTELLKPCVILLAVGVVCFALGVKNLARAEA